MTTELTKAAQQALEALTELLPDKKDPNHGGHDARDVRKWRALVERLRALTQRPAAQVYAPDKFCFTEADGSCSSKDPRCMHQPAAQEVGHSDQLAKAKNLLVDLHKIGGTEVRSMIEARTGSWFVWGQDRSLPAPQQATQAQTEREAFEAVMLTQGYGDVPRTCGNGSPCPGEYADQYWELAWRVWQEARASLPAPQQATPAQEVHPLASRCYAMSEPHLSGYRLVLGFETLEAVDAAHTWVANVRKAPQQATPEPVGEPVAFVNWPLRGAPRLVWYSNKALQDAILKSHEGHIPDMLLYTRPAPGVPEGFTLDQIADAFVQAEISDSKFESLSIALAAQAKGGQ